MLTGAQAARAAASTIGWRCRSRRLVGREGLDDRPDLARVDAPHARVAEFAAAARAAARIASTSLNSVTTQCEGTLPWAWQAEAISSLARTTSGCVNWPLAPMPSAGIAPRCAETKSISPKTSDCTRGCAAMREDVVHRAAASRSARAAAAPRRRRASSAPTARGHVVERLDLGHHQVASRWPARPTMVISRSGRTDGRPDAPARRPGRSRLRGGQRQFGDQRARARPRRRPARRPRSRA